MAHYCSDHLLQRYCAGECTPSERAEVEAWAAADPSNAEMLSLLGTAWQATGTAAAVPAEQPDVDEAWLRVWYRIGDASPVAHVARREPRRRALWRRLLLPSAAAAALTLTVGGGVWAVYASRYGAGILRTDNVPMHQIATHRGQRVALALADGSQVVLAAESRLRIPYAYGPSRGPRDIFLEGEAYFKVKRDDHRPFRVHVTRGVAETHAGAFDVAAYPETQSLEVVTTNDSVALRISPQVDPSAPVFLTLAPGELGQVDSTGSATRTRDASWATRVAWVTGMLVFESTPMHEIARRLGRWYDLDIQLADTTLAERKLTIAFAGGTAEQVLALLGSTLHADVEQQGHTVVFRSKAR